MRPRLLLFVLMLTVMLGDLAFQVAQAQDSAVSLLRQMIAIAADNGGVGHTAELTALKEQIEALPKPARGDRKTARAANDAGLAALDSGQFEQAKKHFLSAVKADPADVEIAGNLGFAAINTGDFKQAIKALSEALALAPGQSSAWVTLGEYFAVQGQRQQAVACYALVYHLSKDRDKTRRFLQKWAVESDNPKVRQAMQQALQLSLISGGKAEDVAVAAIVDEELLDAPLPSAVPASRSLPTAAPPVASLPAPPPAPPVASLPVPPPAPPVASLPASPPAPPVASLPVPVVMTPATVLPPPVIAQPASPDSLPPPDVSVLTDNKVDICKEVVRGFLGVKVQEVTPELAQLFGFNKPSGGLVLNVVPTGPAQVAGIKIDDVILTFNNQPITKSSDLLRIVDATRPETNVPVTVFRKGSEREIFVRVGESPYPLQQRKALGYPTSPDIEDDLEACECVRSGPEAVYFHSIMSHPPRANPKLEECKRAWSARQQAEEMAARQEREAQDDNDDLAVAVKDQKNQSEYFPDDQRRLNPPDVFKGDGRGFLSNPELKTGINKETEKVLETPKNSQILSQLPTPSPPVTATIPPVVVTTLVEIDRQYDGFVLGSSIDEIKAKHSLYHCDLKEDNTTRCYIGNAEKQIDGVTFKDGALVSLMIAYENEGPRRFDEITKKNTNRYGSAKIIEPSPISIPGTPIYSKLKTFEWGDKKTKFSLSYEHGTDIKGKSSNIIFVSLKQVESTSSNKNSDSVHNLQGQ